MTTRAGDPALADAVKSGCSSLESPASVIASRASCRFLLALSSSRDSRSRERGAHQSALLASRLCPSALERPDHRPCGPRELILTKSPISRENSRAGLRGQQAHRGRT